MASPPGCARTASRRPPMRSPALPVESNELYTTYVDFRAADLFDATPVPCDGADAPATASDGDAPEGAAGLIELRDDVVVHLGPRPRGRRPRRRPRDARRGGRSRRGRRSATALLAHAPARRREAGRALARLLEPGHPPPRAGRRPVERADRPPLGRRHAGPRAARPHDHPARRRRLGVRSSRSQVARGPGDRAAPPASRCPQGLVGATTEIQLGAGAVAAVRLDPGPAVGHDRFSSSARRRSGAAPRSASPSPSSGARLVRVADRQPADGARELRGGAGRDRVRRRRPALRPDLVHPPRGQDTTGNLLSKAVLGQGSRAYIKGLISIEQTARGTDSFLGEFGMILDRRAAR